MMSVIAPDLCSFVYEMGMNIIVPTSWCSSEGKMHLPSRGPVLSNYFIKWKLLLILTSPGSFPLYHPHLPNYLYFLEKNKDQDLRTESWLQLSPLTLSLPLPETWFLYL